MSNATNKYNTPVGLQQPAAADLSNGTTGSGAVVLAGSPALTGTPTAPTQTVGDNTTKIATTAFVQANAGSDSIEVNGSAVTTPFSLNALVNGIGPVGEVKLGGTPVLSSSINPGRGLFITPFGVNPSDTDTTAASLAQVAYLEMVYIPAPMLVEKLYMFVSSAAAGTNCQWGLFDFSGSVTAATFVVGASSATSVVGGGLAINTVAAGTPTMIKPGVYALIVTFPAGTNSGFTITRSVLKSGTTSLTLPYEKFQTGYTWTNTPNLAVGWTTDTVVVSFWIGGNLTSGIPW